MRRNYVYFAVLAVLLALLAATALPGASARSARSHADEAAHHANEAARESLQAAKEAAKGHLDDDASTGMWRTIVNKLSGGSTLSPSDSDRVKLAHERSARADLQDSLSRHSVDTSAVDPDSTSVLGNIKLSIDRAASMLGLRSGDYPTEQAREPLEPTLAERLGAFLRMRGADAGHAAADAKAAARDSAKDAARLLGLSSDDAVSDEVLKALHMRDKTLGDRLADGLEAVGLKDKPAAKAAAEAVASKLGGVGSGLDRAKIDLDDAAAAGANTWDKMLKSLGLREKSTIEKAADAYYTALHDVKVALGAESPSLAERLNTAMLDAGTRVQDTTHAAYGWLRHVTPGVADLEPPAEPGVLASARAKWDDMSSATLSSMLHARDVATEATDDALRATGLKPERRSGLAAARDNLDASMHKLMVSLGYAEPTFAERLRGYAGSAKAQLPTVLEEPSLGDRIADAWDTTLKALHLRDKTAVDKARESYQSALHRIKMGAGLEDPTAQEQLAHVLDSAYNRVLDATEGVRRSLPGGGRGQPDTWSDAAKAQYESAMAGMKHQLAAISKDTDKALKDMGLRERSTAEALQANMTAAWHGLLRSLGYEAPTLKQKLTSTTMLGSSGSGGGVWDSLLKSLGLRERSAIEKARDAYYAALHDAKVALGAEEPTMTEAASDALEAARARVAEASHFMLSYVPGTADHNAYDDVSSRTIAALLHARSATDKLLKKAGLKERGKLEAARDAMDASLHDLWVLLGYEQPSLLRRLENRWLGGTNAAKAAARNAGGNVFAAVDAGGEALLQTQEAGAEAALQGGRRGAGVFDAFKQRMGAGA